MPITRRAMTFGLLGTGVALAAHAGRRLQTMGGPAFGSSWRISLPNDVDAAPLRPGIEAILARVDAEMSPYRPTSDLSRFNRSSSADWQPMPPALCTVSAAALDIARLTHGAFDPTVGPTVSRFGFGPIQGGSGSYRNISVASGALRKTNPGLTLDLCGIAKGYALDRVAAFLTDAGVANALVEIGGEVRALGLHPQGRDWQVAIADPRANTFAPLKIIRSGRLALATSGHAANGLHGPLSTSHIIDPHTGHPASTTLLSVSVLAPDAMQADALATALCAAGPDAGIDLARRLDLAALFAIDGADDIATGAFPNHVMV